MKNRILFAAVLIAAISIFYAIRLGDNTGEVKVVAIATLMSHPALDAVQDNLKKELEKQGYVEGKN